MAGWDGRAHKVSSEARQRQAEGDKTMQRSRQRCSGTEDWMVGRWSWHFGFVCLGLRQVMAVERVSSCVPGSFSRIVIDRPTVSPHLGFGSRSRIANR